MPSSSLRPKVSLCAALALGAAGCVRTPTYDGLRCSGLEPCPEGYVCEREVCRLPCEGPSCAASPSCSGGPCDAGVAPRMGAEVEPTRDAMLDATSGVEREDGGMLAACASPRDCASPGRCELGEGAKCAGGRCVYPPVLCDSPPPATCSADDATYTRYSNIGTCDPITAACTYPAEHIVCSSCAVRCLGAECVTDAHCDDSDRCTDDRCGAARTCAHAPAANPDPEVCDGLDNDCNGQVDDIECSHDVVCSVFDDGYANQTAEADAIYLPSGGQACIPGGAAGICRRWLGRCRALPAADGHTHAVTFSAFDDGYANQTGQSDAILHLGAFQSCVPGGASGACRRWFGRGTTNTVQGHRHDVWCRVFDDGYANQTGVSDAVLWDGASLCIPGGASGDCRRWFGRCVAP